MRDTIEIVKIIVKEFNLSGEREDDLFDLHKAATVEVAEKNLLRSLDANQKRLFEEYKHEASLRQCNVEEKLVAYVLRFLKTCAQGPFNSSVESRPKMIRFD